MQVQRNDSRQMKKSPFIIIVCGHALLNIQKTANGVIDANEFSGSRYTPRKKTCTKR